MKLRVMRPVANGLAVLLFTCAAAGEEGNPFLKSQNKPQKSEALEQPRWYEEDLEPNRWHLIDETTSVYKAKSGRVAARMHLNRCENWNRQIWVRTSGSWKIRVDSGPVSDFKLCTQCEDFDPAVSTDIAFGWSEQIINETLNGKRLVVKLAEDERSHSIPLAGLEELVASADQYCGEEMAIWK